MKKIIKVQNFSDTFKEVTLQGILYRTPENESNFIDFANCYAHYLNTLKDEDSQTPVAKVKRVGQHDTNSQPPYIELFTVPITRFEFISINDCQQLRHWIRKNRWITMELT